MQKLFLSLAFMALLHCQQTDSNNILNKKYTRDLGQGTKEDFLKNSVFTTTEQKLIQANNQPNNQANPPANNQPNNPVNPPANSQNPGVVVSTTIISAQPLQVLKLACLSKKHTL